MARVRRSGAGSRIRTKGKRDYRAEYRQRLQQGTARGLSVSQARGHARAGERPKPPRPVPINPKSKEEVALRWLRDSNFSLREAARLTGQSEQHLRRYIKENAGAKRVGNHWEFDDQRPRQIPLYADNELKHPWLAPTEASRASQFMHAVRQFLPKGDASIFAPYEGQVVTDIHGHFHRFETDPNRLYELDARGELNFPEFYKIINPGEASYV
jgi:hypothetical protein